MPLLLFLLMLLRRASVPLLLQLPLPLKGSYGDAAVAQMRDGRALREADLVRTCVSKTREEITIPISVYCNSVSSYLMLPGLPPSRFPRGDVGVGRGAFEIRLSPHDAAAAPPSSAS